MRKKGEITLQEETRLDALRRVLSEHAEEIPVDVVKARQAGRREAEEASRQSGVDYTAAYERMCQRMATLVR